MFLPYLQFAMPLKFDADGDLAFASGQELRDGAKDGLVWLPGSSVFILIDGRGIRAVEKIEDFEQAADADAVARSEEHTSELQSPYDLVCRLLLEKKKK